MKTLIVLRFGAEINRITYHTKQLASKHLKHFRKFGILDPNTGEVIDKAEFELI